MLTLYNCNRYFYPNRIQQYVSTLLCHPYNVLVTHKILLVITYKKKKKLLDNFINSKVSLQPNIPNISSSFIYLRHEWDFCVIYT